MMRENLKLLDCTLRDGGYYNNWQFNLKDANNYLKQVYSSGIDVVEIGFYFFEKDKNYGNFDLIDNKSLSNPSGRDILGLYFIALNNLLPDE